jgi:YfiH family protein
VSAGFLTDPRVAACGVAHGFGLRGSPQPRDLVRPRQVHGSAVARVGAAGRPQPPEADAIVSTDPSRPVGVLTADCIPILLCTSSGAAVAAVHAGWRGLAAGVVEAGVAALREVAAGAELRAALGPHIGPCCYEVDEPVIAPLRERFGAGLKAALAPGRPEHHFLDLGALSRRALEVAGIAPHGIGAAAAACTHCDVERFHSYRREGRRGGWLVHFIRPSCAQG